MKAGKWTIATYFLFFMFPEQYMFIKPTITKNSARVRPFKRSLAMRTLSSVGWSL